MENSLFHSIKRREWLKRAIDTPLQSSILITLIYALVSLIYITFSMFLLGSGSFDRLLSAILAHLPYLLFNILLVFAFSCMMLAALNRLFHRVLLDVEQRNEALETIEQEFSDLTRKMSHDLRAPIRSVKGFSKVISEDYQQQLDADVLEYLNRISKSADKMNSLIDKLSLYVKLASHKVRHESIDIIELINSEVIDEVNTSLDHPLEIRTSGPIPVVLADKLLIKFALAEVLSNAGIYVSPDTLPIVEITGHQYEDKSTICIRDNGIGVDPAYIPKIFSIFNRLHGVETYPGLGIGLAIAKRCMLRMEGNIELISDGTSGCEVILSFPRPRGK